MLGRPSRSFPARALLLAGILAASGCTSGTQVCPAILSTALSVRVTDARTGAFIASGATLKFRFGAYQGAGDLFVTTEAPDASPLIVMGSAGTYDILVEKPDYAPLSQRVVVPSDGCGPVAVNLTAKLAPLQ